ncbi:hypothetical protein GOBAR_AA34063 [Gossypium barbadense]|uniref:Uncharacterized protein n=1 Tax=Gossypium barbadense TaxID=3634 RepID=A0A2P5W6E3_GOSBA|nr:hypothetical protein GOBAR_AA34063 [Gossypium barbadense]
MIIQFLNLLLLVEKNQISDLSKLLNEISGLLNPKLLNAILSLPKLLNEISSLLNPKILNGILSLPKLLNKISGLLKFLNVLDEVRQAYITFVSYQLIPPSEAPTSPQYINKNGRQFLPSWYKFSQIGSRMPHIAFLVSLQQVIWASWKYFYKPRILIVEEGQ